MVRTCPWCKEFDGTKAKVEKLKKPLEETKMIGDKKYEITITHRCSLCGCGFGDSENVE